MGPEFAVMLYEKVKHHFSKGGKDGQPARDDGHGFDHVERVYKTALKIAETEPDADIEVVRASVLLHDIARFKERRMGRGEDGTHRCCHAEEGAKMAAGILAGMDFPEGKIKRVVHAIEVHRYSKGLKAKTIEAKILQDADRLDALGAMIIIRMLYAAVDSGRPIHDPGIPVKDTYDGRKTTVINHIKEKILKITPESFHTELARELAVDRYALIKQFTEQYLAEFGGSA